MFQSTSHNGFNAIFRTKEREVQTAADETGTRPRWPDVETTLRLASAAHQRLRVKSWATTKKNRQSALNVTERPTRKCDNCGSTDHVVTDCPKPRDEQRMAANKKKRDDAWQAWKRANPRPGTSGNNSGNRRNQGRGGQRSANLAEDKPERQRRVNDDGVPQVLNVNNKWVPDTKKINEAREAERLRALTSLIKDVSTASGTPPASPGAPEPAPATSTAAVDQMALIEARVKQILRRDH